VEETAQKNITPKKNQILSILKRNESLSLSSLSALLKISKVAVLKRLKPLEDSHLVERITVKSGKGRPQIYFSLTNDGSQVFPKSYAEIATETLQYVEKHFGRDHVRNILMIRAQNLEETYLSQINSQFLENRIDKLSSIRESEGYMSQWNRNSGDTYEILEFNCPIIAVSARYGEACQAEINLFSKVLDAEVEPVQRIVEGKRVCRFLIREKNSVIRDHS
jgi:predicted ArsR family transcriptional regulator